MALQTAAFAGSLLPRISLGPLKLNHRLLCQPYRAGGAAYVSVATATRRVPAIVRPLVPSETLQQFVEDTAQPRATVLKALGAYIRQHNLQDPRDKRMVICDDKLKELFGVNQCTILEMSKYVTPHLLRPEDVGGKYVDEARRYEIEYISRKAEEEKAREGASGEPAKKKKTRRVSKETVSADKKAGRKLFTPVLLSPELSAICGNKKEMPRQSIVKAVWEYIRMNKLQGPPGEPVRCDALLKKVYNQDTIDVKTVMKGISAHVSKK